VTLETPAGKQVREVRSGGSYLSNSDFRLLFGLGSAADGAGLTLTVRWPSGKTSTVKPTAVDRYLKVEETPAKGGDR
jgi:hypothetical protein